MKHYEVKIIDNTPDWNEIEVLDIDCRYLNSPNSIRAFAQLCCDDNAFYVHLWTTEPETRAVEFGPIGSPSEDSCLELFLCPADGDNRYFNIEFNSNACMYLGIGTSIKNLVRLVPEEGTKSISPEIKKNVNGWEIFYKFSFEFIRRFFPDFEIFEGKSIRANFYKCTELGEFEHYLSWNPIDADPFTFHCPECFGEMILTKKYHNKDKI